MAERTNAEAVELDEEMGQMIVPFHVTWSSKTCVCWIFFSCVSFSASQQGGCEGLGGSF